MENCVFCRDYKKGDIVFETKNFCIKIGVGIVAPGHVMIITKDHYKCMGDFNPEWTEEFLHLKEKLIEFLTKYLYQPFMVENGVILQSVFHAHMHFIPRKSTEYKEINFIKDRIEKFLGKNRDINIQKIENFLEVRKIFKEDGQYLYFEENKEMYVLRTINYADRIDLIKNGINYREFFANLGVKGGVKDWRLMTDEDKLVDKIKIEETEQIFKNFANFYNL